MIIIIIITVCQSSPEKYWSQCINSFPFLSTITWQQEQPHPPAMPPRRRRRSKQQRTANSSSSSSGELSPLPPLLSRDEQIDEAFESLTELITGSEEEEEEEEEASYGQEEERTRFRFRSSSSSISSSNSHSHSNTRSHSHSNTHSHSHTQSNNSYRQHPRQRVYKRWIILTAIVTFITAWLLFPVFFGIPGPDALFERELFNGIPTILRARLQPFVTVLKPNGGRSSSDDAAASKQPADDPGQQMKQQGARAHFPVIMIPGVTSVGLELWEGQACAAGLFRQRLWGTMTMLKTLLMDKACWMDHLRVDPRTGRDPPGIRIRPAQGLEAADFLLPGFWVWAKIIAGLAEVGYDHTNLHMAAYDWRLDLESLEARDRYFTRLKLAIEFFYESHRGRKVVILGHSLGSNVWLYFQKWVEHRTGDRTWINRHIEAFVNMAGPLLGAPKSVSTILSGETRDTATLGTLETYLLESLLSKQERLSLFRTWMGGFAIFPKGGRRIWGSAAEGSADAPGNGSLQGFDLLTFNTNASSLAALHEAGLQERYTVDDVHLVHDRVLPEDIVNRYRRVYSASQGIANPAHVTWNDYQPRTWMNPLESRLPNSPDMKIYCLYGIGHDTERAYMYKLQDPQPPGQDRNSLHPKHLALPAVIDTQAEDRSVGLYNGIYHVDGDATVPLISLSYMCTHVWRRFPHLNPGRIRVITREFPHQPKTSVTEIRGGPGSSDHVDILGNHQLLLDILRVVTNRTEEIRDDVIYSNIREIAKKVNLSFQ